MKALVTGHRGFVGRHFAAHLRAHGWDVTGLDTRGQPSDDARDYFRFSDTCYDLVIHGAAVVGGRAVIENDPLAQAVNFELDAALFTWAHRTKPGRVIYFSSSAAYPVTLQRRDGHTVLREDMINLDDLRSPDELYGWVKLTGEQLARRARSAGVRVSVVRPFSGYGTDQDPGYPFGAFAQRTRDRQDPFVIWGDGRQVRDFIHIDDIIGAVMEMVAHGIDGPVNLGSGLPVNMLQLMGMFTGAADYRPEVKLLSGNPSGVSYRVCDPTRMLAFYKPQVNLREGIRRALEKP